MIKNFYFLCASLLLTVQGVNVLAQSDRILRAVLRGTEGNEQVFGLVAVTESSDDGSVTIEASVDGLPDGDHGFHVHVYGDAVGSDDGTSAGGHYNPSNVSHAGPDNSTRHVGDLGNLSSMNGTALYTVVFEADDPARPTVFTDLANSIIGRSFIVHADPDDLVSQPTGNAGSRMAIGVIGIGNELLYDGDAVEVTEQIDSSDFEVPDALVCKIVGDNVTGFGAVVLVDGVAEFRASLSGLTPGAHGYHIHWYGEEYEFTTTNVSLVERDLGRTGGHYNPTGVEHGLPNSTMPRHYGDGGNLVADEDGNGKLVVSLPDVTDLRYLVGRSCVVHADADDGTDPAGNAGARIAGGQLGYANPDTDLSVDAGDTSGASTLLWHYSSLLMAFVGLWFV